MRLRRVRRRRVGVRRRRRRRRIRLLSRILGRGISRPYNDKKNRLMLGSGKTSKQRGSGKTKQRGGFFPLGALAASAPPIIELLNKIIK